MKADARAVVDTNGLISSALLAASVPARLVMHILRHGRLLFSEDTFTELEQRLWRPKFDRSPQRFSRDPDDDKFRHAAVAGRADVLISGDGHLLELHGCGVKSCLLRPRCDYMPANTFLRMGGIFAVSHASPQGRGGKEGKRQGLTQYS